MNGTEKSAHHFDLRFTTSMFYPLLRRFLALSRRGLRCDFLGGAFLNLMRHTWLDARVSCLSWEEAVSALKFRNITQFLSGHDANQNPKALLASHAGVKWPFVERTSSC